MPLQLSQIHPSKNSITPKESVSLNFTLTSSAGASYVIYYDLAPLNNLYFEKPDGSTTKQQQHGGTMVGNTAVFNDELTIVQTGPKAYDSFTIKVTARVGLNGDVKSCQIVNL